MNSNVKDLIMNSVIFNETQNLSIWNQSQFLSSFTSYSSSSPSSFLVVTQVDVTDLQIYVILKHYLPIPIFIVSILCILVTLIAVTQRGLWRTTVTYIIVLAVVDLFTLLSLCILSMDFFIIPALPEGLFTRVYFLIETILGELVDTLLLISNWLTVLIATERYLAVCHPLKVRFIDCKYRRLFIIFVILLSILIKLPGFILLSYTKDINPSYSITMFRKIYTWIVQILLFLIIPFSILTFVNVRLIQTVHNSLQLINQRCKKSTKEFIVSSNSTHSDNGLLRRITLCSSYSTCCISLKSNKHIYSIKQCLNSLRQLIFTCDCFNLLNKPINNYQLQQQLHQQQNEIKLIVNKGELFHGNESSPVTSPTSLTASEPTNAQLGRTHREEKKITITLICLIVTFFICQGPFVLTTVIMRFSSTGLYLSDTNKIINNTLLLCNTFTDQNHIETITPNKPFGFVDYINPISVIALALKSDLSFFFYCWFCDRFLLALKKILRNKCWSKSKRSNFYYSHHYAHHHLHLNHRYHHSHKYNRKHNTHPHLQKLTKSHQNEQRNNIIELNMSSSGGSLPAEYQLPHHHYKDGGEYYQYRIPSDIGINQHKIIKYEKPVLLPFNLSKHNKKKSVISLPINAKISWSSPSCSDNSFKCSSSSPKKLGSSSHNCSMDKLKFINNFKVNKSIK
ncbi:FMRFamide receptor-like [Schistosoma japonicum]|uniref:FMRFamide receptor-like n=1 Tax=Schistosoma japonicum TaxID=6182 RepID=A0A4Z2DX24_SCHJA|nr:FMRFamide receptor-like [Schistosoma japonicum]